MTARRDFLCGAASFAAVYIAEQCAAQTSASGMSAEFRHGTWFVTASAPADGAYEPFFYAHPEIAASGKPVVVLMRTVPGERDRCWLRMFPDFIKVDASAGRVDIEEIAAAPLPEATMRPKTTPARRGTAPGSLVFMHWNIGHFCRGRSCSTAVEAEESKSRAEAFRAFFAKHAPDVVGVCEYSDVFDKAGGKAAALPFGDFGSVDEGPRHEYQCNAIAVRSGILSRLELSHYVRRRQNTYYIADEVEFGGVRSVFVETHLDAYRDQIRQLVDRFRGVPRIVIAGDFNVPDVSWYEPFFADGYAAVNCADFGAIPTHRSRRIADADAIDNVFVRGWTIEDMSVGDYELALSDHRALACSLSPKGCLDGTGKER